MTDTQYAQLSLGLFSALPGLLLVAAVMLVAGVWPGKKERK